MIWLKQSTAVTVPMGPFVDDTDFKTVETALSLTQAETRLSKNGGAFAQKNDATTASHLEEGTYGIVLNTTDTNTLGNLRIQIQVTGALIVWQDFQVVPANVWDSYFGADLLQVDTTQVGGTVQTAGDIIGDTNDIQTRLPAALVSGRMDSSVGSNLDKTGYALSAAGVQAIWDALTSALTTVNSIGKLLVDNVNATISSRATQTSVDTIDDFLDTEMADVLVDTSTTLDDFVDDLETRLTDALATALQAHALGIGRGVVDALSTTTLVLFKSVNGAAASGTDDFYNGRHIVFTSGALTLHATSITDYTGATKTATVAALTSAPAEDVTFVIV